ncbi:hypothetical protein [Streptomyces zhihengii]|uniref:Helix-turn-helix domain-containing protein n=1 Tax=Streptomyces zhihengii TaxID=1818004 RepID=A0ABS2UTJ9_9ACTN|nr:hypothetical protein [Streptomyces zhihengii]MBM9620876.1 hypothetical protein [Streptomyces zhihengii]
MIHVRTRLTADFTVIANSLLQRPGSAVTVGVAGYILSLPDGAAVSIDALCEHFTEGETLISRALRELETDGYLARRVERGPWGRVGTRTFFHDVPPAGHPARPGTRRAASPRRAPRPGTGAPPGDVCAASVAAPARQTREARGATGDGPDAGDVTPDHPPVGDATQGAPAPSGDGADTRRTTRDRPPAQGTPAAPAPPQEANHPGSGPESDAPSARDTQAPPAPETAAPPARDTQAPPAPQAAAPPAREHTAPPAHETDAPPDPDPRAEVILASLRLVDRRLILSRRETADLVPAVCRWLAGGVEPEDLTAHLTDRLPARLLARPARILAHRLRELPPPLPELPAPPPVLPMVTCDGCGLAFRSAGTEQCRDCRQGALAAAS